MKRGSFYLFRKFLLLFVAFFLVAHSEVIWAQDTEEDVQVLTTDEKINQAIEPVTKWITSVVFYAIPVHENVQVPLVLIWLGVAAVFFTLYFKFINVRAFGLALRTVKGKYTEPGSAGEISHFQALTAALSATVGLGNIAGVAVAISLGGPGATFWMIVMGLFGMTTKFCECTLGVKYRDIDGQGKVFGGPMYYLSKGFTERGMGSLGKFLAVFFCIMCIGGSLGGGNMFQANQSFQQFASTTGLLEGQGWIFGLVIAVLVGAVVIGGIVSIAQVTSKLVPFMCGIYVLAAIVILFVHIAEIPQAFGLILQGAFNPEAIGGGIIGVMIQGIKRATFSNEAGIGSAPIAHAAVKTKHPASEGIVALLEPFIDTVVVCTMTALVIVITGTYQGDAGGIDITSAAFASVISWFPYILSLAVILFAFSTMISWSYYGLQAWTYLFGRGKVSDVIFKVVFCVFVIIGAAMPLGNVIDISDSMIFAMSVPNIIGLYFLFPLVKKELATFQEHTRKVDGER